MCVGAYMCSCKYVQGVCGEFVCLAVCGGHLFYLKLKGHILFKMCVCVCIYVCVCVCVCVCVIEWCVYVRSRIFVSFSNFVRPLQTSV